MPSQASHRLSNESSRSNALPLIPRGQYVHLSGYNHGQPYTLLDLYQVSLCHIPAPLTGAHLSCVQGAKVDFDTRLIVSLPETVRNRTKLTLSIVSINEEEKQKLL